MDNIEKQVVKMREDYAGGESIKDISLKYNWSPRNARNAVSGKTYRHLPNPQVVVQGKKNSAVEREIIDHIAAISHERGYVSQVMHTYNITYETFKRLRAEAVGDECPCYLCVESRK